MLLPSRQSSKYYTQKKAYFGVNVGYIDGTIQSGQQAGQALLGKLGLGGHKEV